MNTHLENSCRVCRGISSLFILVGLTHGLHAQSFFTVDIVSKKTLHWWCLVNQWPKTGIFLKLLYDEFILIYSSRLWTTITAVMNGWCSISCSFLPHSARVPKGTICMTGRGTAVLQPPVWVTPGNQAINFLFWWKMRQPTKGFAGFCYFFHSNSPNICL